MLSNERGSGGGGLLKCSGWSALDILLFSTGEPNYRSSSEKQVWSLTQSVNCLMKQKTQIRLPRWQASSILWVALRTQSFRCAEPLKRNRRRNERTCGVATVAYYHYHFAIFKPERSETFALFKPELSEIFAIRHRSLAAHQPKGARYSTSNPTRKR